MNNKELNKLIIDNATKPNGVTGGIQYKSCRLVAAEIEVIPVSIGFSDIKIELPEGFDFKTNEFGELYISECGVKNNRRVVYLYSYPVGVERSFADRYQIIGAVNKTFGHILTNIVIEKGSEKIVVVCNYYNKTLGTSKEFLDKLCTVNSKEVYLHYNLDLRFYEKDYAQRLHDYTHPYILRKYIAPQNVILLHYPCFDYDTRLTLSTNHEHIFGELPENQKIVLDIQAESTYYTYQLPLINKDMSE